MRVNAGRVVTALLMRGLAAALHRWVEVLPLSTQSPFNRCTSMGTVS